MGSKFQTSNDQAWIADFSSWVNNLGSADDGLHDNVGNFFYWVGLPAMIFWVPVAVHEHA
jgi:hypothetical protein